MISPEFPVSCIFCPNEGGAFKQTNTNQWGHLLCAIWIPEVGVSNTIYMEPIDMIGNVPKSRWKLTCFICRKREGACIQCDNKHCFSAFHVTCAKTANLCMKMNSHTSQSEGVILKAYCDKHTPKEHVLEKAFTPPVIEPVSRGRGGGRGRGASSLGRKQQQQQDFNDVANNKVARAHQHHYSTGAPIAPDTILAKIDDLVCVKNSGIRKRPQMVTAIAHYWSLKRESRRGAPLLKRLHLEVPSHIKHISIFSKLFNRSHGLLPPNTTVVKATYYYVNPLSHNFATILKKFGYLPNKYINESAKSYPAPKSKKHISK